LGSALGYKWEVYIYIYNKEHIQIHVHLVRLSIEHIHYQDVRNHEHQIHCVPCLQMWIDQNFEIPARHECEAEVSADWSLTVK
jgi:hypothetical protein